MLLLLSRRAFAQANDHFTKRKIGNKINKKELASEMV